MEGGQQREEWRADGEKGGPVASRYLTMYLTQIQNLDIESSRDLKPGY